MVAAKAIDSGRLESRPPGEKSVDGGGADAGDPEEQGSGPPAPAKAPPQAAQKKTAGVESFVVKWTKNAEAGPEAPRLRLDFSAKFKKDATHDPALAEFRQKALTKFEVTAGPHQGFKGNTSPLHDDHYSRADDKAGNAIGSVNFRSNDNPGWRKGISKDDVLDYQFTAEDMIIDTSAGNKVIEKRGPHTATIKGKHPRTYGGVPKTLS